MKLYSYKESGVEWLGKVPEHWKIDRVKDVSLLRDEKVSINSEDENYLELEDIEQGTGKIISFRNTVEVASSVMKFYKGDVLFGKLRPYLEKYYLTKEDGYCTGEILAIKPNRVDGEFLKYFVGSPNFISQCNVLAYGAKMPRVNWNKQIASFLIPLPPLSEQKAIAAYLDKACERIDRIIAIKEEQLRKIKDVRKSKIDELVCFGNEPNPEIYFTGLSYLPKIKKGWSTDRFKDVATLRDQKTDEKSELIDYLELEDIEQGTGNISGKRDTLEVESKVTLFYEGDVLFGKLRPYLEKYHYAEFDGKCTGEILAFKPNRINGKFLKYIIGSKWFIDLCNSMSYGAKMPRVNWNSQLAMINLPIPSPEEQTFIVQQLDELSKKVDLLSRKVVNQISALQSYRKSLIHECVTGKKQVSEIVSTN
jgi:type I restriction enzyme, S subunit